MRILCVFGRYNYGNPDRGEGIEYTSFLPALRALGHQVEFFESFSRTAHADFAALNRALLERVEVFRPEIVFTVLMMAEVWLETVAIIRATGAKVINWSTDDSWKYRQFSRLVAREFDVFATTWPDAMRWYADDGLVNAHLAQWAAATHALSPPKPAAECAFQVTFVGSCYGRRAARVARLREAGIAVECFGHGWPNGPVDAARLPRIARDSIVSLNFSEGGGGAGKQIKARVFEVPAAGGLLLTETAPHLERYFDTAREIAVFTDDAALEATTRDLLTRPQHRDAIALAGHARVAREHTYEQRLAVLLAQAGPVHPPLTPDWPHFENCARRHRPGAALVLLRTLLIAACRLGWDANRAPRAARRALFEASWRIAGRHTYTAAGWPGRLFYRES